MVGRETRRLGPCVGRWKSCGPGARSGPAALCKPRPFSHTLSERAVPLMGPGKVTKPTHWPSGPHMVPWGTQQLALAWPADTSSSHQTSTPRGHQWRPRKNFLPVWGGHSAEAKWGGLKSGKREQSLSKERGDEADPLRKCGAHSREDTGAPSVPTTSSRSTDTPQQGPHHCRRADSRLHRALAGAWPHASLESLLPFLPGCG